MAKLNRLHLNGDDPELATRNRHAVVSTYREALKVLVGHGGYGDIREPANSYGDALLPPLDLETAASDILARVNIWDEMCKKHRGHAHRASTKGTSYRVETAQEYADSEGISPDQHSLALSDLVVAGFSAEEASYYLLKRAEVVTAAKKLQSAIHQCQDDLKQGKERATWTSARPNDLTRTSLWHATKRASETYDQIVKLSRDNNGDDIKKLDDQYQSEYGRFSLRSKVTREAEELHHTLFSDHGARPRLNSRDQETAALPQRASEAAQYDPYQASLEREYSGVEASPEDVKQMMDFCLSHPTGFQFRLHDSATKKVISLHDLRDPSVWESWKPEKDIDQLSRAIVIGGTYGTPVISLDESLRDRDSASRFGVSLGRALRGSIRIHEEEVSTLRDLLDDWETENPGSEGLVSSEHTENKRTLAEHLRHLDRLNDPRVSAAFVSDPSQHQAWFDFIGSLSCEDRLAQATWYEAIIRPLKHGIRDKRDEFSNRFQDYQTNLYGQVGYPETWVSDAQPIQNYLQNNQGTGTGGSDRFWTVDNGDNDEDAEGGASGKAAE